jgi:hypothetical protein
MRIARSSALFTAACAFAALVPLLSAPSAPPAPSGFPGWPTHYEGKPLRELPLTSLERRFEEDFPGRLGRFSDGEREIVIRWVSRETRKLHPAIDCFRGGGYSVTPRPIAVDSEGVRWGSFVAIRGEKTLSVRERVYDGAGNSWTDVSSWYWTAFREQSPGPWWAVTVAQTKHSER